MGENSKETGAPTDKLLFRMKHIIPPSFHNSSEETVQQNPVNLNGVEEISIPMSWGNIAAKIWGPPEGRPVFAIHGWLDNAATFDTLIPLLPKNLRIVAVDIAGHGLSSHYPADINYEFNQSLLAIEKLARQLNWKKFSFLGHSMGGCMAMLYASVFPEKVEKLVLLDIVRVQTTRPETMSVRLRKTVEKLLHYENSIIAGPEKPMSYEEAVQKSVAGSFGSLDEKACHVMFTRGLAKVDGGYVLRRDRRLLAAPLGFYPREDHTLLAKEVTADVLIIKFTEGPEFEPVEYCKEHVEALKTKSKYVRYIEVEGKHHSHLTHPERIAPIISDFLSM